MNRAAIDIGTNSVLLLISDEMGTALVDEATICRLGQGLATTGRFHLDGRTRTLDCLKKYKLLCKTHQVREIKIVGTAAFRKATDAKEFVQRVQKETGFSIEIISGEREATLVWKACVADFGENIAVIDVGGGSTEIIPSPNSGISLNIGSVLLFEKGVTTDPITDAEYVAICREIDQHLATLPPFSSKVRRVIATAGSATTLAAVHQKLSVYRHDQVHGTRLKLKEIETMIADFKSKTVAERRKIPGVQKGRADVILVGATILKKCVEKLGGDEITVSDRGVRWGLIYEDFQTARPAT